MVLKNARNQPDWLPKQYEKNLRQYCVHRKSFLNLEYSDTVLFRKI